MTSKRQARQTLRWAKEFLLVEHGHFINTFVYEPEQQIEEAIRQKAEAERVLAEAREMYQSGE
jgi:hypothetical protein